jgi:hypothetical protein
MSAALVWGLVAAGGMVTVGLLFWIAARIAHVETPSLLGRGMMSALFCGIVSAAVVAMVILLGDRAGGERLSFYTQWLAAVLIMAFSVVILRSAFDTTFGRAVAVWSSAIGLAAVLAVLVLPGLVLLVEFVGRAGGL